MRAIFSVECPRNNDGSYMSDVDLRSLFRELGLEPRDMPDDETHQQKETGDNLRSFFQKKASRILKRMPSDTEEHKEILAETEKNTVYASTLTDTQTEFMVVRRANGALLFRLINNRLEFLQKGCEELLRALGSDRTQGRFKLLGNIEIYEHGLEASTIRGYMVSSRVRYGLQHSGKDLVIGLGALFLLLLALYIDITFIPDASKSEARMSQFITAMLTTFVVSVYGIIHTVLSGTPRVDWSLHDDTSHA